MTSSYRYRVAIASANVATAVIACTSPAAAFVLPSNGDKCWAPRGAQTALHESSDDFFSSPNAATRRSFVASIAAATSLATILPVTAAHAVESEESLVKDLGESLSKIETIPSLLENAEWDKVRTVLKTPPVNQLWNLGESQNTLVKLAKETGEFDLVEIKDELAISLQMTDQYSYDNVFIYYQPGNGKLHVKEPKEMANKAISQLKDALDIASRG
ncbi:hypothetical protein ACHAWF_002110 [Thalassiosira exigua]